MLDIGARRAPELGYKLGKDCERVQVGSVVAVRSPQGRRRAFAFSVRCVTSERCRGSLTLRLGRPPDRTVLRSSGFSLARDERRTVSVALGRGARRRLGRERVKILEVELRASDDRKPGVKLRGSWEVGGDLAHQS